MSFDVIVIGEGVAGLTAAGALARGGLKVATLESQLFGGLVVNVNELDPAPDGRAVGGAEFAAELMQANAEAGVTSLQETAQSLAVAEEFRQVVTEGASHQARHVIAASGARLRRLGVPGESEFEGRGVSQCADCDGPMSQNEEVVVAGGGDSALQEALVLARFCGKVHLVHRGGSFRARKHLVEQVAVDPKIDTIWNATVVAVAGGKMVERVRIRHGDGHTEEIPCAGLFAYIGLEPNAGYLPAQVNRDAGGFVLTGESLETALPGVWAIGAVRSGYRGLLADAVDEAQRAATAIRNLIT